MRASFLALTLIFAAPATAQVGELTIGYNLGLPGGSLREHTGALHGLAARAALIAPKTDGRLSAGLDVSTGVYASFSRKQQFALGNAAPTEMNVRYTSAVSSLNLSVRYEALRIGGVGVWAGLRGGGTKFRSGYTIEDPQDADGCKPLESERLARDFALQGGVETGVNVDLAMFSKSLEKGDVLIQLRAGLLRGGAVNYINVRHREDGSHAHRGVMSTPDDGSTPVVARFVNVGTGEEHAHEVARMYTSPVNYVDCGVSVVLRLD